MTTSRQLTRRWQTVRRSILHDPNRPQTHDFLLTLFLCMIILALKMLTIQNGHRIFSYSVFPTP